MCREAFLAINMLNQGHHKMDFFLQVEKEKLKKSYVYFRRMLRSIDIFLLFF